MRGAPLLLLLIPACGGGSVDHPELHLDVVATQNAVFVYATEVDRPDATSQQPFAHRGVCAETSDGWSCNGECPAAWLGELRIEHGGELIAAGNYDSPVGGGIGQVDTAGLDGAVLVIADRDGAEIEVPLPSVTRPVPIIDDVTVTSNGTPVADDVAITWHTEPAAGSAVVELSAGFGGFRCHVEAGDQVTMTQAEIENESWSALVTALAAPVTVETAFGTAEVWVGNVAVRTIPAP